MFSIEDFANDGGTSSSQIRWEPYLEKVIEGYLESNSILRMFCEIYPLVGTYTANLPRSYSTGMAVEVVEGTEIPSVRQVLSTVDVKVTENGTAVEMTDESKMVDWYGNLAAREIDEAARRMLRKENDDIITVLLAGCAKSQAAATSGKLDFNDLVDARTYLKKIFRAADTALVNPDQYADQVKDVRFQDFSKSNTTLPLREGLIGGRIAGLNILEVPEVPSGSCIVGDFASRPLWLVLLQDLKSEAFRIPEERKDKVQMTAYEKPAVLRADALYKITAC